MKVVIVLFVLLAAVTADGQLCGPLQKLKVKQQWAAVFGMTHHRLDLGTAVFRSFFRRAPEVVKYFSGVKGDQLYSGTFQAYSVRVLGGINMIVSAIDDEQISGLLLTRLRDQHKERQTPENYFQVFKNTLMRVIPASIGKCFDEQAWDACLDAVIQRIADY